MKIRFTKDQYKNLIKLVYLGNWMINAVRLIDNQIKKYNDLEQYILSFAKEFGLEKYIEFDEEYEKFISTIDIEEDPELEEYRNDYDEEVFWQEMAIRLGSRDFVRQYGEEAIIKMDQKERFLKEQQHIITYEEEFEKNGIENLEALSKLDDILNKFNH